jgi:hypothetical protein
MSLSLLPLPLQVAHPEKQHRMVVSNLVTNQKIISAAAAGGSP